MAHSTVRLPAEEVPIIDEADVVVVGGGTSGFIAATSAARAGARTILLERFGYLGGCTTAPYNTGLGSFGDSDGNQIIRGLGWEFVERMKADGKLFLRGYYPELWPPWTRKVALDMVEEAGVELYFYTWVSDVIQREGTVTGVVTLSKGGRGVVLGQAFVDATGDADIAAQAGAPFEMTETNELQQVSCDYIACGVDAKKVIAWAKSHREELKNINGMDVDHKTTGAQNMFTFVIPESATDEGDHIGVMPTVKLCIYREAVRLQGNVTVNPLDPKALTKAETEGLRGALAHLAYLQERVPGFEHAFPVAQTHLGVRETRRIIGDYMITIDDLKGNTRHKDVVCLNCRALDYHLKGTVFKIESLKGNHDVPLRSLVPKGIDNVFVSGRSVSCDHLSQASLRGAATCLATGHAAGAAAATAALSGTTARTLSVSDLQKLLQSQDAILST